MRLCFLIGCLLTTSVASAAKQSEAFLEKHCLRCHGPEKVERELRIDQLLRDFNAGADGHLWAEIVERINAREMPPEDEPQPSENEIASVIAQLAARIREGRAARMAARPPVAHCRLSRRADAWLDVPRPEISDADRRRNDRDVPQTQAGDYFRTVCDLIVLAFQTERTLATRKGYDVSTSPKPVRNQSDEPTIRGQCECCLELV